MSDPPVLDRPRDAASSSPLAWLTRLPEDRIIAIIVVALIASWLGYYIMTPLPFFQRDAFNATIVFHAVTGAVVIPYLVYLVLGRRLPGGSALDLAVLAMLGAYLLATAESLDWRVSLEVTLYAVMAISIFYVLSDGRLFHRWQVEAALMLTVAAAAFATLYIVGRDYLEWLRLTDSVRGSVSIGDLIPPTVPKAHDIGDHPNIIAGAFAMALPFFIVGIFRKQAWPLRIAVMLATGLVVAAMFFTLARSSWLGSAAAVATMAVLALVFTDGGREFLRRLWPDSPTERMYLGLVALGLALALGASAYAFSQVQARPLWLFRESGTPRLDVMGAGAEMWQDHTLLGTGPGMFGLLYPEYSGRFPNHAVHTHNGFLQTTLDTGIPGIVAMFLLGGVMGWIIINGLRKSEGDTRMTFMACAGSLVALGVFSLMEAPNAFKTALATIAAVGAIAVLASRELPAREPDGSTSFERWLRLGGRLVVPVAMAGLLITWGRIDIAHFYYNDGLDYANAREWEPAVDSAQRAVDLDPQYAIYRIRLAVVQGQVYLDTGDETFLQDAIGQLRKGIELEPRSAIGYANLALLLSHTTDRNGTRDAALNALKYSNRDAAVALVAGTALEAANWGDDAVQAYANAIFQDLGLADSTFWSDTPFREEEFSNIISHSAVVLNSCALLWLSNQPVPPGPVPREEALTGCVEKVLAENTKEDRVVLGEALIRDGEMDLAFQQINAVVDVYPDYGPGRTALGRWYAALGDIDRARNEWLIAGQLGEVEALMLLGDSYETGQVPQAVIDRMRSELRSAASQVQFNLTGILYYRFKFFRASPFVILLPGDWRDAVPGRYTRAQEALDRWVSAS